MYFANVEIQGWIDLRWRGNGEFHLLNEVVVTGFCEGEWFRIVIPAGVDDRVIKPRWLTDLASVPKRFRDVVSKTDLLVASIVHDWLYHTRDNRGREWADKLFLHIGIHIDKQPRLAKIAYRAVRWFGQGAWDDDD